MQSVNFLRDRIAVSKKKAKKLFLARTWASVALVIYLLIVATVFSLYFLAKKTNQVIKNKIVQEEKAIENLRSIESKQVYLTSKTKSLSEILASKKQHQQIVDSILTLLPVGVSVSDFQINKNGTVSFSASCQNFEVLNNFFDTLKSEEETGALKIKQAKIQGVGYGLDQDYGLSISILFYLGEV